MTERTEQPRLRPGTRPEPARGGEDGVLPPLLSVVRGEPTAEELAALTAVVAALSQRREPRRRPSPVGAWGAPVHRRPLRAGPGGWASSGRPS
ncbi:acyl-CoA carboxylase epsilon subunit [Trujillonella humicola]|uniref:acyl-CoA carboxylase epsilon subunit n=1 Tax=Trujillonella humicola TaxID=3383699 RepID=UPI0039059C68